MAFSLRESNFYSFWPRVLSPFVGVLIIYLFVLVGLYWEIVPNMAWQWWHDPNYSHGFLVPPFAAFLIWNRRESLRLITPRGSWLGLPILIFGVIILVIGQVGAENFLMRSSLIFILAGLTFFHLGPKIFRIVAFPLAFLFFMIPLPAVIFYALTLPLQAFAAKSGAWVLSLMGEPVLLEGNVIHLSTLSLDVVEACSGIRSLISFLAVAAAWVYLIPYGFWQKFILVTSAVPIAMIANVIRLVFTGLIGIHLGARYAAGFFHTLSGWFVFLSGFACLLGVAALIKLLSKVRTNRMFT